MYRARRVLLTGYERPTEDRFWWMATPLRAGDPDGEVSAAWIAKELLRDTYSAIDEAHARRRLVADGFTSTNGGLTNLTELD